MRIITNLILFFAINIFCSIAFASNDFIDKTVKELIQEKITDNRLDIEHVYNSKSMIDKVKANQEKIESMILDQIDPKFCSFKIIVNYNDGKTDNLSGHYTPYILVPVTSRYIKFGDIIQETDLTTKKITLDNSHNSYLTEIKDVVGMQAKKYIASGQMIKNSDVASPNIIKNGDPVNIIYSTGVINLKTIGTSMGAGAIGDMLKVKNSSSGAVLLGQIINKNTVKIGSDNE
ncbi:MAG: flagellar basal body P-ring formation protein FlgA [Rickettsiales bacterium]|nr:MAG: flagellar basal body P-ring formation protein FlgA [Rickettsiales bacterium]